MECCEIEDDEGLLIMIVKNKIVILEEFFGWVLEENEMLKLLKEIVEVDLVNVNEEIMWFGV